MTPRVARCFFTASALSSLANVSADKASGIAQMMAILGAIFLTFIAVSHWDQWLEERRVR